MMQAACNCNKLLLQILIIARITNSGPIPEYVYVTDPKSWFEADAYCLSEYQSNLASIHNKAENTAVFNICTGCWIGYSDTKSEGTLVTAMVQHMIISQVGVLVVILEIMVLKMIV
eukprot:527496_1